MISNLLYVCYSFSSIHVKHEYTFYSIIVALYFFELPSNDVVMAVHVEVKFKKFDEAECYRHNCLFFDYFTSWFRRCWYHFGFLFGEKWLKQILFAA